MVLKQAQNVKLIDNFGRLNTNDPLTYKHEETNKETFGGLRVNQLVR